MTSVARRRRATTRPLVDLDRTIAELRDRLQLCETKRTVRPALPKLLHAAEAAALELRVADRQHLVDEQDLGLEVRGDREREAHVHAARVALDGRVDELLDSGELDDLVEALRRSLAASSRGSRRSGRCSRGR